jgi:hypothetical protein
MNNKVNIKIDESICENKGLNLESVLLILLIKRNSNIFNLIDELLEKQIIVPNKFNNIEGNFLVTQRWDDVCSSILLLSDNTIPTINSIEELALQLMAIFPKGKKEGTSLYWKGNKKDITLRLQKFFKLYGNTYTNEEILTATRKYVESFNGDYSYMRILKYFIWKDAKKYNSEGDMYIEEVSDLASFIENAGQENELKNDWNTTLR